MYRFIYLLYTKSIERGTRGNVSAQVLQEQAPGHIFDNNNMKINHFLFIVAFLQNQKELMKIKGIWEN